MAGAAAQGAVGAGQRAVVDGDHVLEAAHAEAVHARVDLVDGVPPEALLDAADGLEAGQGVELQRTVDVAVGDLDRPHRPVGLGLDEDAAGEAERRVGARSARAARAK